MIDIKAIKRGLLSNVPIISVADKMTFGKYKNTNISDLVCTRPGYLLWLERNGVVRLEQTLKKMVKETVSRESMRDAMFDSMCDEYYGDYDDFGLTAYDLGADF